MNCTFVMNNEFDDIIDACVEMIYKLRENNLL